MYKYAQIYDNKVHCIMEHEAGIDELYKTYFSKDIVFIDITNISDIEEGWNYNGVSFTEPTLPTNEELLEVIRLERNVLLAQSDWTQFPDVQETFTEEKKQEWIVYRQALRDFTETCDPANPEWPIKPE